MRCSGKTYSLSVCHFELLESSLFVTSAAYSLFVDIVTRQDCHKCSVAICNVDLYRHTAFLASVYLLFTLHRRPILGRISICGPGPVWKVTVDDSTACCRAGTDLHFARQAQC